MASDSIKKRYALKLQSKLVSLISGLIVISIVPKVFGSADYGRFDFLNTNFATVLMTVCLSIPLAFFNWTSGKEQNEEDPSFLFTLCFIVLTGLLLAGSFVFLNSLKKLEMLWPDTSITIVLEVFTFAFFTFVLQFFSYLYDGKGKTAVLEFTRSIYLVLKSALVLGLYHWNLLSIKTYCIAQSLLLAILITFLLLNAFRTNIVNLRTFNFLEHRIHLKKYVFFVWEFIKPLAAYGFISWIFVYFDRWILQFVEGSSQQGYYALGNNVAAITFVFVSALQPILAREFVVSDTKRQLERLNWLFNLSKLLFICSAIICIFTAFNSENILKIIGGSQYIGALPVIVLLSLYPIHQTFGQITSSFLLAVGKVRIYTKLSIFLTFISAPISYILVAPKSAVIPGMELGALGLSIKNVAIQLVGTNLLLLACCRHLNTSYRDWLYFQLKTLSALTFCAFVAFRLSGLIAPFAIFKTNSNFPFAPILTLSIGLFLYVLIIVFSIKPLSQYLRISDLRFEIEKHLKEVLKKYF